MAARRRRTVRRYAGRSNGRRFFWIRLTPSSIPLVEAASATHAGTLVTQADWEDPEVDINNTRKGGARLERLIVQFGLSIEAENAFFAAGGAANIALIPEFMVWHQTDQFVPFVNTSLSFDAVRSNQRIVMDEVPPELTFARIATSGIRTVGAEYETKSKVRLAEGSLCVAWRGQFDEGDIALLGYTDWVRATMLISIP